MSYFLLCFLPIHFTSSQDIHYLTGSILCLLLKQRSSYFTLLETSNESGNGSSLEKSYLGVNIITSWKTSNWLQVGICFLKYNLDGSIAWCKVRLVAKGFLRTYGGGLFWYISPISKIGSIWVILSLDACYGWNLHQLDIKTPYWMVIYMKNIYAMNVILKNSLYGLKKSSRAWFEKLRSALLQFQFMRSNEDYSLFYKRCDIGLTLLSWMLMILLSKEMILKAFLFLRISWSELLR